MTPEYMASKLLGGRAVVTPRTAWWPRHSKVVLTSLSAVRAARTSLRKEAERELRSLGTEWDRLVSARTRHEGLHFMREHSALEIRLVEAVAEGDIDMFHVAREGLRQNARQHRELLIATIEDFPVCEWTSSFHSHNEAFAGMALLGTGKDPAFRRKCLDIHRIAALRLARISEEWL